MIWLALLAALAGFAALALQADMHGRRWLGGHVTRAGKRRLRRLGFVALALAFAFAIAARGWVFGPIAWFGLLMLAAAATFLFVNMAPGRRA